MTGRVVRLVDSSDPALPRTLTTERTTYDFRSGIARFSDGGVVTTETERIEKPFRLVRPRMPVRWSSMGRSS